MSTLINFKIILVIFFKKIIIIKWKNRKKESNRLYYKLANLSDKVYGGKVEWIL
jgi:hypothetical protein